MTKTGITMRARLALVATALALPLAVTSCGGGSGMNNNAQFATLMQRPDIDQVTQRYDQMATQLRQQLSVVFPQLVWYQDEGIGTSGCGSNYPNLGVDGESRTLANWATNATVPDNQWNHALQIVDQVIRPYGFNSGPITPGSDPSIHWVTFYDQYQGELIFTMGHGTGFGVLTGCHLTAAAKKRGHPVPATTY